jgi:hypothetical protein
MLLFVTQIFSNQRAQHFFCSEPLTPIHGKGRSEGLGQGQRVPMRSKAECIPITGHSSISS